VALYAIVTLSNNHGGFVCIRRSLKPHSLFILCYQAVAFVLAILSVQERVTGVTGGSSDIVNLTSCAYHTAT
jgi:hypothetical protein